MNGRRHSRRRGKSHLFAGQPAESLERRVMLTGTVYTVNSLQDAVAPDGRLTLREAIQAANTNTTANEASAGSAIDTDRIEFDVAALQAEAGIANPLRIVLTSSTLSIAGELDIVGPGADVLTIDANAWGGVVRSNAATLTFSGVTLTGGNTSGYGGGIYASGGTITLADVTISENKAYEGGGIYATGGTVTLTNVTLSENTALRGGGIYTDQSTMMLTNVIVSGNAADYDGGGIHVFDGTAILTNVTIRGNTASTGAGIHAYGGTATLTNVTISENTASDGGGGGISMDEGTMALTDVTISGNTASWGGGISAFYSITTLTNVTISGNAALGSSSPFPDFFSSRGGGLCQSAGTATLENTIVAHNTGDSGPDIYQDGEATLGGGNNLIGDGSNQTGLADGMAANLVGTSVSPIDPRLAEGSAFGVGLTPLPGSPAIDAGDDSLTPAAMTTDVYGTARIQGAHVNIGAVETVLPPMPAVTYGVTSLDDSIAADGVLTLREALAAANSNLAVSDAPAGSYSSPDRIEFAPGLTGTILAHGDAYQIMGSLALTGPGISLMTIDATGLSGVLDIRGPYAVTISGLTLTGGEASGNGGGIFAAGVDLTLDQLVINGNSGVDGGGIYASGGAMALTNVMISGNTASAGAGIYADADMMTLTNVTTSGNTAYNGGGGIYADGGMMTLMNVSISGNTASDNGGGIYASSNMVTLTNGTISGNAASRGGGIWADGTTTLTNVAIRGNTAYGDGSGGGIYMSDGTTTLTNVTISGTTGDGIYMSYGTIALTNVTISGNDGNGIYIYGRATLIDVTISGNYGHGIYMHDGTTTLANVTISGNTSGGIYADHGMLTLTNVTISGNTGGGGIYVDFSSLALTNVTISGNTALDGCGGVHQSAGTLTLQNTIVAHNAGRWGSDIFQLGTLGGANNLIGDGSNQTGLADGVDGNLVGTSSDPIDPRLAEGTTFGIGLSPLPGSPAIDAGDDSLTPAEMTTDVYGTARIQGAHVNIGAVETVLPPMPAVTYVVTSLDDSIAADGVLTLREALAAANSNLAVSDAPARSYSSPDRIGFAPGLTGTILTNGDAYSITGSLTLTGPGLDLLALDGQDTSGILDINGPYAVAISGLTVTAGHARSGGGILAAGVDLTLDRVAISGNTAFYGDGGGIHASAGTLTLTNVTISDNTASGAGGGIYASSDTMTLINVAISGNTGAGIGGDYGTITLTNVTISGNAGSGICAGGDTMTLTNVMISGNTAYYGGGIYTSVSSLTLTNVTISGNTASYDGGGGIHANEATMTLNNSIVTLNHSGSGPEIIGEWSGMHNLVGVYPGFVHNPEPGLDGIWGTADDDYGDLRLKSSSPAINAGDNALLPSGITTDVAGNPRIADGIVDIGAYEGTVVPTNTRGIFGLVNGRTFSSPPLQDKDGDIVTLKLTGGGIGTVYGLGTAFEDIILQGTTSRSVLTISVKKGQTGDGLVEIENIRANAPLKSISAGKCDITGSGIYLGGNYVGRISIRDLKNGADVTIGGDSTKSTSIAAGVIEDGSEIASGAVLSRFSATKVGEGTITAPGIASFCVTGSKSRSISGDLCGDIVLNGAVGSTVLGKLSVKGIFSYATVRANSGNMGSLTFGAVEGGHIYAGYAGNDIPNDMSEFTAPARIARMTITGIRGRSTNAIYVQVAAAMIGSISWSLPDMFSSIQIAADSLDKVSGKFHQDDGSIRYESASKLLSPEDSLQYEELLVMIF